jgi:hypothetical protein
VRHFCQLTKNCAFASSMLAARPLVVMPSMGLTYSGEAGNQAGTNGVAGRHDDRDRTGYLTEASAQPGAGSLPLPFRSYRQRAVSRCGPLRRGWRSAAFLRRAEGIGLRCRWLDYWGQSAPLSAEAPPPTPQASAPRETQSVKLNWCLRRLLHPLGIYQPIASARRFLRHHEV